MREKNTFFTLLMGKEWHEWKPEQEYDMIATTFKCTICNKEVKTDDLGQYLNIDFYRDLSGFQIIKEYMEKNLPEVWEEYLEWANEIIPDHYTFTQGVNIILSLDNLLTYLLEHKEEWGWVGCPDLEITTDLGKQVCANWTEYCAHCEVLGKVKSPALLFAEGKEER